MSLFGNHDDNNHHSSIDDVRAKINEILGLARHSIEISVELRTQIAEINRRLDASEVIMMPKRPTRNRRRIIREKE